MFLFLNFVSMADKEFVFINLIDAYCVKYSMHDTLPGYAIFMFLRGIFANTK